MSPAISSACRSANPPFRPTDLHTESRLGLVACRFLALISLCILGLFIARAPLALGAAVVLGSTAITLLLRWPTVGTYALAFAIPFGSLYELNLGGLTVGVSEGLTTAIAMTWALRVMAFRRVRLRRSPLVLAMLFYLATLVASFWPATDLTPAFKETAKWGEFLLLYLFVASELERARRLALVAALLLAGTLQGALGIYQFVHQVGPPGFVLLGRYMRAHGTFLQPNPFAGYLGLLLPLACATALISWEEQFRKRAWPGVWSALTRSLAALSGGVMLAGLIMSWSRGALLGLVGGATLIVLRLRPRVWVTVVIALLMLVLAFPGLVAILPEGVLQRLSDAVSYTGQDLTSVEITDDNFALVERAAHWVAAWRMFTARPWLGVGTGQYAAAYPSVALPRWEDPLGHAHNYYLNVLAEGGLLGLTAYVLFALASLATAWRSAGQEPAWRRGLALGALGMLGHLLVHSLFDNLYVHEMYLLVAILLGMTSPPPEEGTPRTDRFDQRSCSDGTARIQSGAA